MRQSEFWEALELAFGSAQGHFLARDLHLVAFDATAEQALEQGVAPAEVWVQLIIESGADESIRWIHRRPRRVTEASNIRSS